MDDLIETLVWIAGGVAAILAFSNWKTCSSAWVVVENGNVVVDANGHIVIPNNSCGLLGGGSGPAPPGCQIVPTTTAPALKCLLNPFPGGL